MGIFKDKLNLEALKRFYRETDNSYVRKLLDGLIVKLTQLDIGEEEIGWSFRLHEVGKVISYTKGQVYGVERTFKEDLRPENEVVFIYPEKFHLKKLKDIIGDPYIKVISAASHDEEKKLKKKVIKLKVEFTEPHFPYHLIGDVSYEILVPIENPRFVFYRDLNLPNVFYKVDKNDAKMLLCAIKKI
eukprot:GHVP01017655.1.p1 GENE.GHVP01017655.1~~GHVP01017655.1.p1  ORF type:complete len:203 (-),score=38.41 GHVP01017655.1:354-914(-)